MIPKMRMTKVFSKIYARKRTIKKRIFKKEWNYFASKEKGPIFAPAI